MPVKGVVAIGLSVFALCIFAGGLTAPAYADEAPAHIAIILDDSGSMSGYGKAADVKGIAAFAASQVFRIVPAGARLALFTYASIKDDGGNPLYYYKNKGLDSESRFSAKTAAKRITERPNREHPYNFLSTPCDSALKAGLEWLDEQRTEEPQGRSTLFFLTDGGCYPKATENVQPDTIEKLKNVDLFCVDFSKSMPGGKSLLSKRLRKACNGYFDVPSGSQLASLNVLKGFGEVMDVFEARHQSTRLMGKGVQGIQNADKHLHQAGKIDVFTTRECPDSKCVDDPLLSALPEAVTKDNRVEKGQWTWWKRRGKRAAKGDEFHPFQWMYLRLSPAELATLQGALAGDDRQTLVRPEWDVGVEMATYHGKCEANGKQFSNARSATKEVCVRARLKVRTDANQRESASFDTFHAAYLGTPQGQPYPAKIAAEFTKQVVVAGNAKASQTHDAASVTGSKVPMWQETLDLPVCDDVEAAEGMSKGKMRFELRLTNRKLNPEREISRQARTLCFAPGDADNDGVKDAPYGPDCDPTNAQVNPNMPERCDDSIDNDCDNQIPSDSPYLKSEHTRTCLPGTARAGKTYKLYVSSAESNGINEGCANSDSDEFGDQDPRSTDDDMDGCPDSADRVKDFCNPTQDCPNKCDWQIANVGQCRLDDNGHVAVDLGQVDARKAEVVCRIDVESLQFDCTELQGRKEFTAVFEPDPPHDQCLVLKGEPSGYRIQHGKATEIRLTVVRSARCGDVSPVSDEAQRLKVARTLGGTLKVRSDDRPGLSTQFIMRRFKVKAFYPQSIDFTVGGPLVSGNDGDKPTRLEITPTLGTFERRFVTPRFAFETRSVEALLTPYLKPKFELDTPKGKLRRSKQKDNGRVYGLSYFNCMSKTGLPQPVRSDQPVQFDASATTGAVCIGLNEDDLSICPGGTLFTPCDETPDGATADILLVHFGLGKTGQLLTPTAVVDQKQTISVRIERGFGDWFWPAPWRDGGGHGWWWIVIFLNCLVGLGCWTTYKNSFEKRRVLGPAIGWFVTIWLGVATVIWNYGVLA